MKKIITVFIAFSFACVIGGCTSTGAYKSVDASQFDIAGVKLGMSVDAAVTAITSTLHVDKAEVKFAEPYKSLVTGKEEFEYFTLTANTGNYKVSFEPNALGKDLKQVIVSSISYTVANTGGNKEALKVAAIKKYGEPSHDESWCLNPPRFGCGTTLQPKLYIVAAGETVTLTLSDPRYMQALPAYKENSQNTNLEF